jgi:Zn-dependent protease with chaperone function
LHESNDTTTPHENDGLVLGLQLAFGTAGLIGTATAVVTSAASVHHDPRAPHQAVVLGGHFSYPALNLAAVVLLALAALGAVVIGIVLFAAWRHVLAARRFMRGLPVVGPLPGRPSVTLIAGSTPQAFCAGYLKPRVYVSAGALALLSPSELAAVLSHERDHLNARDPLRVACTRVLGQALFFLPALRPLCARYSELAERRADNAAVAAAGGSKAPLASALLAFDAADLDGAGGISPWRVDSLLGVAPQQRLPIGLIALSAAAVTLLIVAVWRASAVASAHATLALPLLSSRPCMLMLALLAVLACLGSVRGWRLLRA